jgi:hypothetical protein
MPAQKVTPRVTVVLTYPGTHFDLLPKRFEPEL